MKNAALILQRSDYWQRPGVGEVRREADRAVGPQHELLSKLAYFTQRFVLKGSSGPDNANRHANILLPEIGRLN
jgi:hypothetical protein